jgi:hypothetical protein
MIDPRSVKNARAIVYLVFFVWVRDLLGLRGKSGPRCHHAIVLIRGPG